MKRRFYNVLVEDRCDVVERGEALEIWFVEHNDGWVKAHEHPARVEAETDEQAETTPPGTVWIRRVELRLEVGTALRLVRTWPRPVRAKSAEAVLRRDVRGVNRAMQEVYFRVRGSYALVPDYQRNSQRPVGQRRRPRSERAVIAKRARVELQEHQRDELAHLVEAFPELRERYGSRRAS